MAGNLPAEIKFAQNLAANEKKIRIRAVKKLKKYLRARSSKKKDGFTKEELLKLWKGLHYCMWMQDKPLEQEELCDLLTKLVHDMTTVESKMLFLSVFFTTEAREWNSIDIWRLDKFMMLVRNMFNESLVVLRKLDWQTEYVDSLMKVYSETVMKPNADTIPDGLKIHFSDLYLDEVKKVCGEQVDSAQLIKFLDPFILFIQQEKNPALVQRVIRNTFDMILSKTAEKLKQASQVTHSEEDDNDEEEEDSAPSNQLNFDMKSLADHMFERCQESRVINRNRPHLYELVRKLQDLDKGIIPKERWITITPSVTNKDMQSAVNSLVAVEVADLKKKRKKKHKKSKIGNENEDPNNNNDDDDESTKTNTTMEPSRCNSLKTSLKNVFKGKSKKDKKVESDKTDDVDSGVKTSSDGTVELVNSNKKSDKGAKKLNKAVNVVDKTVVEATNIMTMNTVIPESYAVTTQPGEESVAMETRENDETTKGKDVTINGKEKDVMEKTKHGKEKTPKGKEETLKSKGKELKQENKNSTKVVIGSKRKSPAVHVTEATPIAVPDKHTPKPDATKLDTPKSNSQSNSTAEEGEVEIWIPNKKYKKASTPTKPKSALFSFDKSKPPMAFVRKSLAKVEKTPKSGRNTPGSAQSRSERAKRVSFDMKKNKAQGFKESLKSPVTPYNPSKKPDQGILKSPASASSVQTRSSLVVPTVMSPNSARAVHSVKTKSARRASAPIVFSPHPTPSRPVPVRKRANAADFFL